MVVLEGNAKGEDSARLQQRWWCSRAAPGTAAVLEGGSVTRELRVAVSLDNCSIGERGGGTRLSSSSSGGVWVGTMKCWERGDEILVI